MMMRVLVLISFAATLILGCQQRDTRISVEEFLAMEHAMQTHTAPSGTVTTQPATPTVVPWDQGPYTLGPGDIISINISELATLNLPSLTRARVGQDGKVTLETVGDIELSGLTLDEAEDKIHDAYVPKYIKKTQVQITVDEYRMIQASVLGQVALPQVVELRGDKSSVLHALLSAGWLTGVASGEITWLRAAHPDEPIKFNLTNHVELARAARNGVLNSSDVIIAERGDNDFIFVQGLVNTPGAIPMPSGTSMSVLQAIAAAGGTRLEFAPKDATLMRRRDNGHVTRVALNLHKLGRGEQPDLALEPGDLVLVPHTVDTRVEEFIAKTLYLRVGVDAVYNPWVDHYFREDFKIRREALDQGSSFDTVGRIYSGTTPPPAPAN